MKKYIIALVIFLLLIISLGISIKSCSNIKQEKARLENNQDENVYQEATINEGVNEGVNKTASNSINK